MIKRAVRRVPDLREQVFTKLREDISTGVIGDGQRLTEMTVAKLYNVSRTPAREALALLDQAGLLVQNERGYRLPSFSRKDLDDVFEVRHLIEPYAVRCVCADGSDAELKSLERFAKSEFARSAENIGYVGANERIRSRLFQYLRNEKLNQVVNMYADRLAFIRVRTLRDPAVRRISVEGNQRLIAAVVRRDADAAESCMRYLLNEAHKATITLL